MADTPTSQVNGDPSPQLVAALKALLHPLIRLLMAKQVTYTYLVGLLKDIYVEVAERDFPVEGKRQTDSRISLLTGVHRKDVRRLRGARHHADEPPPSVSLGAQLVARWTGLPEYLDETGRPRPLRRLPRTGVGGPSFEGLVRSVSKDIRPRSVLDEWLRLGVARVDEDDYVWLNVGAFVPERGFEEKAYYFGRNVHDHLAAAVHNLLAEGPPFLERSVYYDELSAESVKALGVLAEEMGMKALHAVNRKAIELQAQDVGHPEARERMNFGIYYFTARGHEPED
jgi:hypothetical protein